MELSEKCRSEGRSAVLEECGSLDELNIPAMIKLLSDRIERIANRQLAEHGVTFSQVRVLLVLSEASGGVYALKTLEKKFQVSQQTMAGIILRLEKKNFVTGFADLQDKRIKKVQITEAGRHLAREVREQKTGVEEQLLTGLDEQEKTILWEMLQRLCDNQVCA